ncbi:MAG: transcription antitermination factor NusB [Paludibacteraceae bacterium]|nr:transcription antitermination factor NusB [Paludibacteraceae bacterium]
MINRTLIRIKVVQTMFAYNQNDGSLPSEARKQLLRSFADTYDLYMLLLDFASALTSYADEQLQERIARSQATHTSFTPNRRFIRNRFAEQLFTNQRLRRELQERHLSWETGMPAVRSVYLSLVATPWYREYMDHAECTYEDDKRIWRKIYTELLPGNEAMLAALEEMELELDHFTWVTDLDFVLSYVVKSVRKFREEEGVEQSLLEMFDSEEDLTFATSLLQHTIEHRDEYNALIDANLKNWDPERVAWMDRIILLVALAEIINFPEIALQISLNEYIEIAKEYSGNKNYFFINGILDGIIRQLKREDKLLKAVEIDN